MAQQEVKPKVKLTVSGILTDLKDGIDRKGIKEKYGLTTTEVAELFKHEKLKGARVRKASNFELEDDTVSEDLVKEKAPAVKKKTKVTTAPVVTEPVATAQAEEIVEEEDNSEVISEVVTAGEPVKEIPDTEEAVPADTVKKGLW